jgi:hypothetical protein
MNQRATFTLYVSLPEGWGPDQLETAVTALIGTLATADVRTLNATWAANGLGRSKRPTGPVLVFKRPEA